jgi:hypothetical protein
MPYKKIEEYEPRQRGMVSTAQKSRGNRFLRDGDHTPEECPDCGFHLRVRRTARKGPVLWCPCGYEIPATAVGGSAEN